MATGNCGLGTTATEVSSVVWQKIFAAALFLLLSAIALLLLLQLTEPVRFPNTSIQRAVAGERGLFFAFDALIFYVGFCIWWATIKYRLFADDSGIQQSNGFRTRNCRWADASFYEWQQAASHRDCPTLLILRDSMGRVIFQTVPHALVSSLSLSKQQEAFWQFVVERLDANSIRRR